TVTPAAAAGTWTLTLPTTGGTNNYALTTNGSGTTTWTAVGLIGSANGFSAKNSFSGATVLFSAANYISSETGSNNAIAGALTDGASSNVTLAAGLCVTVKLGHTLQAGANTFVLNGTSKNIKSHFNAANDIGTAYAATGFWSACYDGTQWL